MYKENTAMKDKLSKPWNAEQWLSAFGKAESDTHMLHALRKQVYEYTVQAAMQGFMRLLKQIRKPMQSKSKRSVCHWIPI